MDRIVVGHEALATGSQQLAQQAAQLNEVMTTLEGELSKTLGGNWEGQAKQAYIETKARWDSGLTDLTDFLNTLGGLVGDINDRWSDTDNRGSKMWG